MYLIFSSSLHPTSRSRIMAHQAQTFLTEAGHEAKLLDLRDLNLPSCDGATAYGVEGVSELGETIRKAQGIIIATPIYNYDVNAAIKNLVELTGRAWTEQVIGFLCAAGGRGSYMSVMALANSLMLDFRTFILPRFVYAEGRSFDDTSVTDPEVQMRVKELTETLTRIAPAIRDLSASESPE